MAPEQQFLTDHSRLVAALQGFAARLYGQLRDRTGNVAVSPYSVASALALLAAGAAGGTRLGILQALGIPSAYPSLHEGMSRLKAQLRSQDYQSGEFATETANALWLQTGWSLQAPFAALADRHYAGVVRQVDFKGDAVKARATINQWVAERTRGKIVDLIPTLPPTTRFSITNALWLKCRWVNEFEVAQTCAGPFHAPMARSRRR